MDLKKLYDWKINLAPSTLSNFDVSNYEYLQQILKEWLDGKSMFRNWCNFLKFIFWEKATCVKTERGAVIQTQFCDRNTIFRGIQL